MTCRTPCRWSRPPAAALLALLAGAFAPTPAHAGCGAPRGPWHGPDVMPAEAAPPPATPAQRTPCHGPGCSKGPSQPLTVPVAPLSAPVQDSACVTLRPPFSGPDSSPHRRDDTLRLPPPHPSDVYHPPR